MRKTHIAIILIFIACMGIYFYYRSRPEAVDDHMGPEIHMEETTIRVPSNASEADILAGITAVDAMDGDVTGNLFVEQLSNFVEKGRRNATIAAIDSSNHVTKTTREVVYTDYHSPLFEMRSPLVFNVGSVSPLDYLNAYDPIDGDVTDKIVISDKFSISTNTPGDYPMLFSVTNSAGDVSELPVTVSVRDPYAESKSSGPTVTLSTGLINVPVGEGADVFSYVQSVRMGNITYTRRDDGNLHTDADWERLEIPEQLTMYDMAVEGPIDFNTVGSYELKLHFTDFDGNDGWSRIIVFVY
jgi:hypothetical protein